MGQSMLQAWTLAVTHLLLVATPPQTTLLSDSCITLYTMNLSYSCCTTLIIAIHSCRKSTEHTGKICVICFDSCIAEVPLHL